MLIHFSFSRAYVTEKVFIQRNISRFVQPIHRFFAGYVCYNNLKAED